MRVLTADRYWDLVRVVTPGAPRRIPGLDKFRATSDRSEPTGASVKLALRPEDTQNEASDLEQYS
jgi:hypothetical protein